MRTCEGELRQISQRGNWSLSEPEYIEIIAGKTAALFEGACAAGAVLTGAGESTVQALAAYGRNTGIAFQITDDLLDLVGEQDKTGKPVAEFNRCSHCHSGPKGTNQKLFDVGTRKTTDNSGLLKSAPLTEIALTAPYLHDGSARTLEEIWTIYNPDDKHGRTNDLTKDELNDLIEYLRTR